MSVAAGGGWIVERIISWDDKWDSGIVRIELYEDGWLDLSIYDEGTEYYGALVLAND